MWLPVPKYQIGNLRGLDFKLLTIRIYAPGKDSTGVVDPDGLNTVKALNEYNSENPDSRWTERQVTKPYS